MIKYEGTKNNYLYNSQDLEDVISLIQSGNYWHPNNCTQEKITALVTAINKFISGINEEKQTTILERHETEQEAREYFGEEFIIRFDQLLTELDKQQTIVAIHGTNIGVCKEICEHGLKYRFPSLMSTAVSQDMSFNQADMHYQDYEGLLNWKHRNYKGLVILAIPYECYYKEGLWNHFADTGTSAYGGQDYRINPDFVVGYIDVEGKNIIINPKYSRQHDYQGYERDIEIFKEMPGMTNDKMIQLIIEASEEDMKNQEHKSYIPINADEEENQTIATPEEIASKISELTGTFNSIKLGFPDGMSEDRHKSLLDELSPILRTIQTSLPNLKTDEQVTQEQKELEAMFANPTNTASNESTSEDGFDDFDWDDIEWNDVQTEEKISSQIK